MALRPPLVLASGEPQQLQGNDFPPSTILGGVLVSGAGEQAANGVYYPTDEVRNGQPVRVNYLTGYEMAIDAVVSDPSLPGAAVLEWGIFREVGHGTTGAYWAPETSGPPYDASWSTSTGADSPPWAVEPVPSVTQARPAALGGGGSEPVSNGNPAAPEIVFDDLTGDVVMSA